MSNLHNIDGVDYPRVTSVIGLLSKPFLPKWSANCSVDGIEQNFPSIIFPDVDDFASGQISIDELVGNCVARLDLYRLASKRIADEAKEVGGLVHQYINVYFNNRWPDKDPPLGTEFASAITAFHEWRYKHKPSKVYSEIGVCDPVRKYAGICDYVGLVNVKGKDIMVVADFKCSPRIYEPETRMQISAYMYALERYDGFFRSTKADGGACVRLDKKTNKFHMKLYSRSQLRSAFAGFSRLLEYWHLTHRGKK